MRGTRLILLLVLLAACRNDTDAASDQRPDPSLLTNSSGEVELSDGGSLDYVITSERYRNWDAAQRALTRSVAKRFGQILDPRSPSEQSINRAVAYLEGQPAARAAIERTGMTVRDFVVMTVALEQQMQLAASRGSAPAYAPEVPMDSGYLPAPPMATPAYPEPYPYPRPQPYPQYPPTYPPSTTYPAPVPAPSSPPAQLPRRTDTVRSDTATLPLPNKEIPRRDTLPRRDTVPARRDTILLPRNDTTPSPPDSVRSR